MSQQQMWFIDRLQPDSSLYNIPMTFRMRGALEASLLQAACQEIVRRHDVLRARFPEVDGVPVQVVAEDVDLQLPVHDLSGLPEAEREAEVRRRFEAESLAPFDLEHGPLLRMSLTQVAEDDHVLTLVFHHIVFDGSSRGVLLAELMAYYEAGLRGEQAALPAPSMQYADYVKWESEQDFSEELEYWQQKFNDLLPRLQLPTDRSRPAVQTHNGAVVGFDVDNRLAAELAQFSREAGTTPFVTMLAAFQVLLARYTGQSDIAVGVPVFGRSRADLERVIGCFVNTLPIRVDLSGDPTFRQVLDRVNDETLDAFDHMAVQFDEIVRVVQPERDPSYTPLVQVTFGMLTDDVRNVLELPGLTIEQLDDVRTTAKFDLSLDMLQTADRLTGEIEYNVDLFDESTTHRMVGHWLTLLEAVAATPDRPISELPLLTAEEWERSVICWNRTEAEVPGPRLMHQLFEEQASRVPDAVAVVYGDERISYADLDRRANQLAHLLREHGIGPEVSVGVCMERSIETVVALLGILKAGGIYAPLDPEYPCERLAFMLKDSRVGLLVTDRGTLAQLPDTDVPRLLLDEELARIEAQPVTAPPNTAVPANLACMFYTSGSSGLPKCGMLLHTNYVNYFRFWERKYLRDTPMRVHMQMTSFAFDIFIADTTRALFSGATLVVVPRDVVMSPPDLYALMVREGVNSAEFITPILAALVDYVEETGQTLEFMDLICAGSDIWYARDFLRTKRLCKPSVRLIAAYGTSETSNDNSTFEQEGPDELQGLVPIGRPVANTQLYVFNDRMQPTPVGIPGELHIGGISLGRGYHRRPGLTAERFVPNPLGGEPGSRLYRTGDLARFRPDGILEILGRVDNQVKVRGFRIELGEIESALRAHPAVDHAVVVARELGSAEKRLIGYLTIHPDTSEQGADVEGVRTYLEASLPGYMVPSILMTLDEMPLSANGKLDRRALPDPSDEQLSGDMPYTAPRTPAEEVMAGIWADVLGLPHVGIHDNFFSMGGSSLLMTQVVSRIRAIWSVELPVRAIYREPTVMGLAAEVAALGREGTPGRAPVTRVVGDGGDHFETSFAQQQLWFHEQLDPAAATYNVPTALRLSGPLDRQALSRAFQTVVDRHEVLRTQFVTVGSELRQRVLPMLKMPVVWLDLSGLPEAAREAEMRMRIQEDERLPFVLAQGPLLRVTVLSFASDDNVLILNMHHAVTDGWSTTVMFDELSAVYAAELKGGSAQLPDLPVQYRDFASWQRTWLEGDSVRSHAEYWRKQLAQAPAVTALPTDRPRSGVRGYAGGYVPFALSAKTRVRLKKLSSESGATLFMTLLASFQALLSRYSGETDIVVGTSSAGRTQVETERLLGFFVNMLPLRTDLSGNPSFTELVRRVRETAFDAYAHQDLPFEKIVEAVRPPRRPHQNPVFQVAFVMQDAHGETLRLPGIAVVEIPVEYSTSKFDLSLLLAESEAGLQGSISYKSDLFDAATVERLAADWLALIDTVVAAPQARLESLPPLAPRVPATEEADEEAASEPADGPVAPRTPLEEVLAAIWCEVLEIEELGVHDNFFLLGGYSLLVTRVVLMVEELLGQRIPVRTLFENATVALLADRVEESMSDMDRERLASVFEELGEADQAQ
ncbi:amino acid adenylation domain-containing protein [Streptomyces diacarni]|uniref:amino acid adenylation domain-containing protein n=1 Tax=Streptomyces diacarni TaxID=2800381 RepID=UPI0033F53FCF